MKSALKNTHVSLSKCSCAKFFRIMANVLLQYRQEVWIKEFTSTRLSQPYESLCSERRFSHTHVAAHAWKEKRDRTQRGNCVRGLIAEGSVFWGGLSRRGLVSARSAALRFLFDGVPRHKALNTQMRRLRWGEWKWEHSDGR